MRFAPRAIQLTNYILVAYTGVGRGWQTFDQVRFVARSEWSCLEEMLGACKCYHGEVVHFVCAGLRRVVRLLVLLSPSTVRSAYGVRGILACYPRVLVLLRSSLYGSRREYAAACTKIWARQMGGKDVAGIGLAQHACGWLQLRDVYL